MQMLSFFACVRSMRAYLFLIYEMSLNHFRIMPWSDIDYVRHTHAYRFRTRKMRTAKERERKKNIMAAARLFHALIGAPQLFMSGTMKPCVRACVRVREKESSDLDASFSLGSLP